MFGRGGTARYGPGQTKQRHSAPSRPDFDHIRGETGGRYVRSAKTGCFSARPAPTADFRIGIAASPFTRGLSHPQKNGRFPHQSPFWQLL